MRTLRRNKQRMYYSLQSGEVPVYETDDDGNTRYILVDGEQVPVPTGRTKLAYGNPVEFFGSITMSGSNSEVAEYGIDLSQYSAVLIVPRGLLPLTETSLIWHNTKPTYNCDGTIDKSSADYSVAKISSSPNIDKYVLKALTK